jgi:hypothetical protein
MYEKSQKEDWGPDPEAQVFAHTCTALKAPDILWP